jgi:hypothetical protein
MNLHDAMSHSLALFRKILLDLEISGCGKTANSFAQEDSNLELCIEKSVSLEKLGAANINMF